MSTNSSINIKSSHILVINREAHKKPVQMHVMDRSEFLKSISDAILEYECDAYRMGIKGGKAYGIRSAVEANMHLFIIPSRKVCGGRRGSWTRTFFVDGSIDQDTLSVDLPDTSKDTFIIKSNGKAVEYVEATPASLTEWALAE